MSIYSILPFLVGLWFLGVGLFVFTKNRNSMINISFALEALSCVIWLFGYAIVYSVNEVNSALFSIKFIYIGVLFIPVFFYHFTSQFLASYTKEKIKIDVPIAYFISIVLLIFLFSGNKVVSGVYKFKWGYYAKAGILHNIYLLFLASVVIICLFKLNKVSISKRTKNSLEAKRIRFVFYAFAIGFLGGFQDFLPNYGIELFYPFGSLFVGAGVTAMAYAIVRHKVLDIEVIIKRTLVFAGMFSFVFGVFISVAYLVGQLFGGGRLLSLAITSIIVVFAQRPIENFLRNITDKFLFQRKYAYERILKEASEGMRDAKNLKNLINTIVKYMLKYVRPEHVAVLIVDRIRQDYFITASRGRGKIDRTAWFRIKENSRLQTFSETIGKLGFTQSGKCL